MAYLGYYSDTDVMCAEKNHEISFKIIYFWPRTEGIPSKCEGFASVPIGFIWTFCRWQVPSQDKSTSV